MMEIGPAGWVGAPKALRGLLPMRVAVAELLHRAAHDLGLHARKRQIRCQDADHRGGPPFLRVQYPRYTRGSYYIVK